MESNYIDKDDKINIKFTKKCKSTEKFIFFIETFRRTFFKLVDKEIGLDWDHCKSLKNIANKHVCSFCSGEHKSFNCNEKKCLKCIKVDLRSIFVEN